MKLRTLLSCAAALCVAASASMALADARWTGGGATDRFDDPANWDTGIVPSSPTDRDNAVTDGNVARNLLDGTNILIEDGIDANAFAVQIGHPKEGAFGTQAASNTLTMTGGSLTTQGNFLFNVGRGTNVLPGQLVQFNMSGGVVNAAGITVPEAFSPGVGSVGINAEMHVSGDSIVNTDLLRLGAQDANSVVTISDNAQVNLTDDNNGFAPGVLWIEAFEDTPVGTSLLDIRDNGVLTVHGEWWTDENGDGMRGAATQSEADYIRDNYVNSGWIVGNGGANPVGVSFSNGVITLRAVPEPATVALLLVSCPLMLVRRRA